MDADSGEVERTGFDANESVKCSVSGRRNQHIECVVVHNESWEGGDAAVLAHRNSILAVG